MQFFKIHSLLLSWISFRKMDSRINFCGGGGAVGWEVMIPWSWSLMNKVAFLGPIMSRSKRFKSILMPDLGSTAKSYRRNNVLNIARWFITKFCSCQSCLPCRDVLRIFGAETPEIEIAVNVACKTWKINKTKQKVELFRIFTFHQYQLPYHTKQKTKNWRGCTYGAS